MMIKCSKCGFENQMGAIFCRGCGEKIDMNALDPETVAKSKNAAERGKKIAKFFRHMLGIIILLAIVGAVGAAFIPCGDAYTEAPEAALKSVTPKIELLGMENLAIKPQNTFFTVDEINALFNQRFLKKDAPAAGAQTEPAAEEGAGKGFYEIEHVQFSIHEGKLHVTLHVKLVGKVPMTMLLVGTPKLGDEVAPVGFNVESAAWGRIPMNQDFLRKAVTDKYAPLAAFDELKNMFKRTEKIEMKEDRLVFSFRKNSKAPRATVKDSDESERLDSAHHREGFKKQLESKKIIDKEPTLSRGLEKTKKQKAKKGKRGAKNTEDKNAED